MNEKVQTSIALSCIIAYDTNSGHVPSASDMPATMPEALLIVTHLILATALDVETAIPFMGGEAQGLPKVL